MASLGGRRFTAVVAALLALGIAASYSNGFGIGFYFDDLYGISSNPTIRSLRNLPTFFTDPFAFWTDRTQADVRPFLLITYALNYAISGLAPWSYHVLNLLLHFVAALLVFVLVRDHVWWPPASRGPSGEARIPAAAAALFFALAPLNTQPVNYVWARSALLATTLYLGAFLAFLRRRWTLGAVLFALALLTKAIAVTLPVMLLIHHFLYRDRTRYPSVTTYVRDWRRLRLPILLPAALTVAYVAYRAAVLPSWTAETRQQAWVTPRIWFMSQWSALLYYVRLFVWPEGLSADHDFPYTTSLLSARAWVPLLVLVAWVAAALRVAARYPQVTFATAWFLVTLAPESSFAPLAEVVNDHRPYIASSLGLSVLLAWVLERAAAPLGERRRAAFIAVALLLSAAALPVNRYRTWQWGDALRIWDDTVAKSPNNARAWVNAGQVHMARGDLAVARRYYERARELAPGYLYVYINLSVLEAWEGHLDAALAAANEAVRLRPDNPRAYVYLGRVLAKLGRTDEARAAYGRALYLAPRDGEAEAELAQLADGADADQALMSAGMHSLHVLHDPEEAAGLFRKVLEHQPAHYGATYQLATALDAAGRPSEARPVWEKVLTMAEGYRDAETSAAARARLAQPDVVKEDAVMKAGLAALYERHDPAAAAAEFRKVLGQNPTHYGATYQLAAALDAAGRPREARPMWEKVLAMAEQYDDEKTAAAARARLQKQP
jgi:tetratricopeptide (TPR) repeat protein